jgi:hypothetical protein
MGPPQVTDTGDGFEAVSVATPPTDCPDTFQLVVPPGSTSVRVPTTAAPVWDSVHEMVEFGDGVSTHVPVISLQFCIVLVLTGGGVSVGGGVGEG